MQTTLTSASKHTWRLTCGMGEVSMRGLERVQRVPSDLEPWQAMVCGHLQFVDELRHIEGDAQRDRYDL